MKRDTGAGATTGSGAHSKVTPKSGRKKGGSVSAAGEQRAPDEHKKLRSPSIPAVSASSLQLQPPTRQALHVSGGASLDVHQQNVPPLSSGGSALVGGRASAVAIEATDDDGRRAGAPTAWREQGVCGEVVRPPRSPTDSKKKSMINNGGSCVVGGGGGNMQPPTSKSKARGPTLDDALDDVQVRFVLNLPEAELSSADRLFFQLEQAWWFYEDFIADAHPHLPHFRLKEFAQQMFQHCEALRPLSAKYNELFEHFKSWKGTIPTAGCVLLNAEMTKLVLVKGWKGNSRGLPKGKINEGEPAIAAALREVLEETGYDAAGRTSEKDCLTLYVNGQQTSMYIVTDVDEGFAFEPQVRKEISAVEWFPLDALPKGSFGVEPFMPRLRRWMAKTKGMPAPKEATAEARTQSTIRLRKKGRATSPDIRTAAAVAGALSQSVPSSPAGKATPDTTPKKSNRKAGAKGAGPSSSTNKTSNSKGARANSAPSRRVKGYDTHNRDTFGGEQDSGGGGGGGRNSEGWAFEAMLAANERLTGRTFTYDGNPHEFGDPVATTRQQEALPTVGVVLATGDSGGGGNAAIAAVGGVCASSFSREEDQVAHLRSRGAQVHVHAQQSNSLVACAGSAGASAAVSMTGAEAVGSDSGCRSQSIAAGSCTEGARGGRGAGDGNQGVGTHSFGLWGNGPAPSSSTPAANGGGLFGEFKFDMLEIMKAVPQG